MVEYLGCWLDPNLSWESMAIQSYNSYIDRMSF